MTDDRGSDDPPGVLDSLLSPLRLPVRVASDIESLARTARSLSDSTERRLRSIDDRAGALVDSVGTLHTTLKRVAGMVEEMTGLEETVEQRMEGLRKDLNTRMLALEACVRALEPPISRMGADVSKIKQLLPEPSDGPLTRLKDTLTSSE